jgi:carbamoyl-phosphate synthase large subunit
MTAAIKVLITGAGTVTCQSVIKGFRLQQEMQVHITTVDPNPMSAGRYLGDAFYGVPLASDPGFLPALLEIVRREGIQLLIPIVDYEFPKLSKHRDEFERQGCRVVISSPQTISTCNEKEQTHRFFREIGIASPKTWLPVDLPSPTTIPYPIFVKPRAGRASLGIHKICDVEEFTFWSKRVEDPLYQEFVEGDEYTIDVLCDFDGRVIGVVPRQRIEMKVGISYKGLTVRDPEMIRAGKFIAEKAGIIGPANIQCFKTQRGLVFFEINPRFSGTLPLTIAAGLNSPLLLARCAVGQKVGQLNDFEDRLLMLRFWDEVFVSSGGEARRADLPIGGKTTCDPD